MPERAQFTVAAIGVVHRPGMEDGTRTAHGAPHDPAAESVIEIYPEWEGGLEGIEGFSHLAVIVLMDRVDPLKPESPLTRRMESANDLPSIGLFATRSPRRPNPIALYSPRLLRRDGRNLHVSGMDAWPGTPVLDIKAYYPRIDHHADATIPGWLDALRARRADQPDERPLRYRREI